MKGIGSTRTSKSSLGVFVFNMDLRRCAVATSIGALCGLQTNRAGAIGACAAKGLGVATLQTKRGSKFRIVQCLFNTFLYMFHMYECSDAYVYKYMYVHTVYTYIYIHIFYTCT